MNKHILLFAIIGLNLVACGGGSSNSSGSDKPIKSSSSRKPTNNVEKKPTNTVEKPKPKINNNTIAYSCKVIKVIDGDTFTCLKNGKKIKVRMAQIDAPEKKQSFGKYCTTHLERYILDKDVTLQDSKKDKYGKTLATVFLNSKNINKLIVADGCAWVYKEYLKDYSLVETESLAKHYKKGLWLKPNPIYPSDFRKQKNKKPIKVGGRKVGHYTVYPDGTAVDNNTDMMWARCSIGQEWNGSSCTGKGTQYTWNDASIMVRILNDSNYLGYNDWQLPHIEDLATLIECDTGFKLKIAIPSKHGGQTKVGDTCKSNTYLEPSINKKVFSNTDGSYKSIYWSSTLHERIGVWGVFFRDGDNANYYKDASYYVRPVRYQ